MSDTNTCWHAFLQTDYSHFISLSHSDVLLTEKEMEILKMLQLVTFALSILVTPPPPPRKIGSSQFELTFKIDAYSELGLKAVVSPISGCIGGESCTNFSKSNYIKPKRVGGELYWNVTKNVQQLGVQRNGRITVILMWSNRITKPVLKCSIAVWRVPLRAKINSNFLNFRNFHISLYIFNIVMGFIKKRWSHQTNNFDGLGLSTVAGLGI